MITRKASAGFILLAIIVFAVASYDMEHAANPDDIPLTPTQRPVVSETQDKSLHLTGGGIKEVVYRPPIFDFGKDTPVVITACIEAFALFCYLIAKRIEPSVIAWERSVRERVASEQEDD